MADATAASATGGWFPVFTLLLGAGITLTTAVITSLLQHRLTSQRERETRRELRRDQLLERQTTFQRATLLELQEVAMDIVQARDSANSERERAYNDSGVWDVRISDDVRERIVRSSTRLILLRVRVRDATLREYAQNLGGT